MKSPRSHRWCLPPLAVTSALLFPGCGTPTPETVQVSGEVFMVTKSGENVRLGLVEVRAIPEAEFLAFVESKRNAADAEIKELGPAIDRARWLVRYSEAEIAVLEPERNFAYAQAMANPASDEASQRFQEVNARALAAATRMDARRGELKKTEEKAQFWRSAAYYFQGMPAGIASTKTDADGRFSLTLPLDQAVALVAQAERQINGGTERSYWCVRLRANQPGAQRVVLGSDNQVSSGSPTSLLHLSE
jgi:hypothetical protein